MTTTPTDDAIHAAYADDGTAADGIVSVLVWWYDLPIMIVVVIIASLVAAAVVVGSRGLSFGLVVVVVRYNSALSFGIVGYRSVLWLDDCNHVR